MLPGEEPDVLGVEAVGDVDPFDQHGAVEFVRLRRPPHDDASTDAVAARDDAAGR